VIVGGTTPASCARMTAPRQILRGATYMVTRRCSERRFFLRPSATSNAIFQYVLAVAASRHNVRVHAYCVMSNHYHLVVTDPDTQLPEFSRYLDSLVARATNASLGRWEALWAQGSYSAVALASPDDILEKTLYVLSNPVDSALVQRGCDWPGLWSAPEGLGTVVARAARPEGFFRENGYMPKFVDLELALPPGFASAAEFRDRVGHALASKERHLRREMAMKGRGFMGVARVLAQKPTARPSPGEPRRGLDPRVAARDRWKRIEVLTRLVEFLEDYRKAWRARRDGEPGVVFPAGTYLLRVAHGVRCVAA
jgi:REP element-mobilizing transposase RayT